MKYINHLVTAVVSASLVLPAFASEITDANAAKPSTIMAPTFHQWKVIAAAEADILVRRLGSDSGPWIVKAADSNDSRFSRSFSTMLISELAVRGIQVTTRETATAAIELQVASNALRKQSSYQPGTLSLITGGVWLVKGLTDVTTPAGVLTALAFGTDVALSELNNLPESPAAELAVTLIATRSGSVATSNTSLYLLSNQGQDFYAEQPGRILKFTK